MNGLLRSFYVLTACICYLPIIIMVSMFSTRRPCLFLFIVHTHPFYFIKVFFLMFSSIHRSPNFILGFPKIHFYLGSTFLFFYLATSELLHLLYLFPFHFRPLFVDLECLYSFYMDMNQLFVFLWLFRLKKMPSERLEQRS